MAYAILYAKKAGNMSAVDVWTATLNGTDYKLIGVDTDATTVLSANSFAINVDMNTSVLRLSTTVETGSAAGGSFTVATDNLTITADIKSGTSNCLKTAAGCNTLTLIRRTTAGIAAGTAMGAYGFGNLVSANVTIQSNVIGGSTTACFGVYNSAGGTITLNLASATIKGGTTGAAYGVDNNSTGKIICNGVVLGGTGSAHALAMVGTGNAELTNCTLTGSNTGAIYALSISAATTLANTLTNCSITGGAVGANSFAISNTSTATITITGNSTTYKVSGGGGATTYGVYNASTGTINITATVQGGTGANANGVYNATTGVVTITGNLVNTATAQALFGKIYWTPSSTNYFTIPSGSGSTVNYTPPPSYQNLKYGTQCGDVMGYCYVPSVSDVRKDVRTDAYGYGTCVVPDSHYVLSGVAVDAYGYTGSLILPDVGDVRIGVNYGTGSMGYCYVPDVSNVRYGVPVGYYGAGSLIVPTPSDVRRGCSVDSGYGLCAVPDIHDVRYGVEVDSFGSSGVCYVPDIMNVRAGIPTDAWGNTGLLDLPYASDVRLGISYDNDDSQGTLVVPIRRVGMDGGL